MFNDVTPGESRLETLNQEDEDTGDVATCVEGERPRVTLRVEEVDAGDVAILVEDEGA